MRFGDLVARFLFSDGCFVMVVASGRLILGWGLRWWVGLASGDCGFTCFCLSFGGWGLGGG